MTNLIIAILVVIIVILITLYFVLRSNIKNIITQLSNINSTKTNSKILVSSSDTYLRSLAVVINQNLEEKLKTEGEYKRMDLELRQANANISHDLRTPLTSILGYMQLIEDNSISETERQEYISIVKKRSQSLQVLISSFYDLSRLESREYKFELKSINISSILCDIIAAFYKDFLDHGLEPSINIEDKVLPVIADENAVRRVFSNLIQNILKHGKGFISIALTQQKGCITTIFENAAPDLTEEDAAHLFERFFTADRMRTGNSTGLGLAITKELIEQMGHSISAKLHEGRLIIEIKWKAK